VFVKSPPHSAGNDWFFASRLWPPNITDLTRLIAVQNWRPAQKRTHLSTMQSTTGTTPHWHMGAYKRTSTKLLVNGEIIRLLN